MLYLYKDSNLIKMISKMIDPFKGGVKKQLMILSHKNVAFAICNHMTDLHFRMLSNNDLATSHLLNININLKIIFDIIICKNPSKMMS